ncbi:CBS domain-containing protein [Actinomadura sp. NPDC047616]|uniref:CBS domain-containing protein n=1 Tax=Actinomadura sp. NPDC047616 TaxID=3155914 RepID=UPI0033ECC022
MQAHELARPFPVTRLDADALEAARMLAEQRLPGLIVVDDEEHPVAVLPGSQILRFVVPRYVQDDPTLARVYDEGHADRMCQRLGGRKVRDVLIPERAPHLPVVPGDAQAMEIAALMADAHSPVVAVVDGHERGRARLIGAITVSDLLGRLLPASATPQDG